MSEREPEPGVYDAIVIGSGFAGAVTACRLAEAGLRICILERGRRFTPDQDFPVYPTPADPNVPSDASEDGRDTVQPDVSRMFWKLGNGVWDFRDLGDVMVGQAAGYGGGSLIYANVHLRPPAHVFDERWPIKRTNLEAYYDLAAEMLDVAPLPDEYALLPKKVQLERAAGALGQLQFGPDHTVDQEDKTYLRPFSPPLAVNFVEGKTGQGVCDLKGNCCLGCPEGAKNTLDFNYLQRAENPQPEELKLTPADVRTLAEVVGIERTEPDDGRFTVRYLDHNEADALKSLDAKYVFLCAGAVNTTELLLRCREAKKPEFTGNGLGTLFHPNQDNLSAVFDCEEPHELDRGPTITSSLVYDREPDDGEPSARWRLAFDNASFEPTLGSTVKSESGGTAKVAAPAYLISGSYEAKNATGELTLTGFKPAFKKGDELSVDGKPWGLVYAGVSKLRHWFLIQDGGLPVGVEPAMGVFRSPLWLGRNAFREKQRPPGTESWPPERGGVDPDPHDHIEHAAASQRIGYATLPIEALSNLLSGLTRGSLGFGVPEVSELGFQLLHRTNGAPDDGRWHLLPRQLDRAIHKLRDRALDGVGLATEGIVSSFLEDAAESVSKRLDGGLAQIGGAAAAEIQDLNLASRALRLGAQLLWGSQSGLARAIARQVFETSFSGRGQLVEAGVDLLRRVLDYRLGNGRAAMLLSFGLDSVPGRLELDLPAVPAAGTEIRGSKSETRAILLKTTPHEDAASGAGTDQGTLIVAGATGAFVADEMLFAGSTTIGTVQSDEPLAVDDGSDGQGSDKRLADLPLRALHFKRAQSESASSSTNAPLRARLPESIDTPERGVQERVLRDIASTWDGELRTDPLWTCSNRRMTVHAQGGCPMGPADRAVTDVSGKVYGVEGLFVMDAAAFPGPVGVNPSATIAAIAEYKVAKFIKENFGHRRPDAVKRLEEQRQNATNWVEKEGRAALDPFGPSGRLRPKMPACRSVEPAHQPVGIEFTEKMVGLVKGSAGTRTVQIDLTVRIEDLSGFVARHARDSSVSVPVVDGQLTIGDKVFSLDPEASSLVLMARAGLDESGQKVRRINYRLVTDGKKWKLVTDGESWKPLTDGKKWTLKGKKNIEDDPGFDAWEDTTKLKITKLTEAGDEGEQGEDGEDGEKIVGELLLPAEAFFNLQLPSFKADTDDPARQAWAMAAFGTFFFGNLAAVYLPGLDRLGELTAGLKRRGRG
jgi:choline dehydrogenase-like flavoprotein